MKKLTPRLDLLVALSSATIGCCGLMYVGGIYSYDTFIYKAPNGYDITNTLRKRVRLVESHRGQPLTRLGIVIASFTFCLSSWLAARRLEPDISFEEFKQANARERSHHHESLKSENAIHMMNMDSQLARAAADFRTRMQIAVMRVQEGDDFNEMAEEELENQMFAEETPAALSATPPPDERRPHVTPLDITFDDDFSTLEYKINTAIEAYQQNQGFTPLFSGTTKDERVDIARKLHGRQFSKSEIIYLCWGVSREDEKYEDGCTMLERMLGEPPHPDKVELSDRAKRLLEYLQKRDIYTPDKAISAEKVRVSKIIEGIGTAEVRDLFVELRQAELAAITEEGKLYLLKI